MLELVCIYIIFSFATRKYLRKNHKLRLLSSGNFNFLYHIQTEGVGTKIYGVTGESLFDLEGGKDCTNSTLCIAVKMQGGSGRSPMDAYKAIFCANKSQIPPTLPQIESKAE